MGEKNTVKGRARNNSIVGFNNQINNGINNSSVIGTLAEVTATNSLVRPVSIPEVASQNLYGNGAPHFVAQTVPAPSWG